VPQSHSREEILETYERYVSTRDRVEAGELGWQALADFFTEDATFIDPAWGRIEGRDAIRQFLGASAPTAPPTRRRASPSWRTRATVASPTRRTSSTWCTSPS
jgi:hypothetical protein